MAVLLLAAVLPAALLSAQEEAAEAPPPETAAQSPEQEQDPSKARADEKAKKKPGIPVEDLLVRNLCGRCHTVDDRDHMTRISYVRKSPEGWSRTIKRMIRLHGLQLTPTTAKALVRALSNSHGLAREEAERGLYDSERRVHWSEEHHDEDFKRACAQCHPLGRALLQHRDADEWQLLRATHVAMFPLASRQMGGGPPREERPRPPQVVEAGGASAGASAGAESQRRERRGSVGDRVLARLTKDQPLFTKAWESWTQNRREVPLAGTWTVHGHETGRGDVIGTVQLTRTAEDEYDLNWELRWSDGSAATRSGKGLLYAGYSWRGRSSDPDGTSWREVLLLDDAWQQLRGRIFSGAYDEVGLDVTLVRDTGRPAIVALGNDAIPVPASAHPVDVYGEAFPEDVAASDFFVGDGLVVAGVDRRSARHVVVRVDAEAGAKLGTRTIAYGPRPGRHHVKLYDTVDYVRIRPLQGLSRVGGARHPKQLERFEAFAVHRGKDEKPYTDDDVDLFQVRPKWSLAEFRVRDDDDDLAFVGAIDERTGVFTPNVDGPNPARKWQANNVGDVYVVCAIDLDVPLRPEPPAPSDGDDAKAEDEGAVAVPTPPRRERRTFRARAHLVVTVPLYARWMVLDWEDR